MATHGDKSVELDALDPNLFQKVVERSIRKQINVRRWNAKVRKIEELQVWIKDKLDDIEKALDAEVESLEDS